MKSTICVVAVLVCLSACGGQDEVRSSVAATDNSVQPSGGPTSSTAASFEATISGALHRKLQGEYVPAGSRYNRYHINMISTEPRGADGSVVIAFGRDDTNTPSPGTYTLADRQVDGFSGSVEIRGDPQRDFEITSGELVITEARGDALTGHFDLTAKESPEEYGGPSEEIRVRGTFRSQPAK